MRGKDRDKNECLKADSSTRRLCSFKNEKQNV